MAPNSLHVVVYAQLSIVFPRRAREDAHLFWGALAGLLVAVEVVFVSKVCRAQCQRDVSFFHGFVLLCELEVAVQSVRQGVEISWSTSQILSSVRHATHRSSNGRFIQSGSMFMPGWGHAGHRTAKAPSSYSAVGSSPILFVSVMKANSRAEMSI